MKTLYHFQEAGVEFLQRGGKLLAAEPGLGKTVQAIEYAKRTGARSIAVLCPAIALGIWRRELADQWSECRVVYMNDLLRQANMTVKEPVVVVCSYDLMVVNRDAKVILHTSNWDLLICDEAHQLKNPLSKRTLLTYGLGCTGEHGLVERCKDVILLTATPMLNHPGELYPHLRALGGERVDGLTYQSFVTEYCTRSFRNVSYRSRDGSRRTKLVEQITGARPEKLPQLAKLMREFWKPVKTTDVHKQMPPLQVVTRLLPQDLFSGNLLKKIDQSEATDEIRRILAEGRSLREADVHLASLRRAMAGLKVQATTQWVLDLLESGVQKVGVWGWHTKPLEALRTAFAEAGMNPVMITGETPTGKRAGLVAPFQEDPDVRVFVGQIQAAGTAITLTAASRAVFLEQAWTPALNFQALKRHHRIGSTRPVLAEMLAIEGSIDEAVNDVLARKASEIATLERS